MGGVSVMGMEAEPFDGEAETFVEGDAGFPTEESAGLGDVGAAALGVVFGEGVEDDFRGGGGEVFDVAGEFEHGHFGGVAEVDGEAFVAEAEADEAIDEVGDVAEAAGLFAGAEDGNGLAAEGLAEEGGDDAAVVEFHAGAEGVEDAGDGGGEVVGAMEGHGEGFGVAFGFVVAGAGTDGVDVAPIGFALGVFEGVAVTFRGGGEEEAGVPEAGGVEELEGAFAAGAEGFDGVREIVAGAGRGGEVHDDISGVEGGEGLGDVVVDEAELGVGEEVVEVGGTPGEEVVETGDGVVLVEKGLTEVGADETGCAGDEEMQRGEASMVIVRGRDRVWEHRPWNHVHFGK